MGAKVDAAIRRASERLTKLDDKPYCPTCRTHFQDEKMLEIHECEDFDEHDFYEQLLSK